MSRISGAIREIQTIDSMAREDRWMNRLHPLSKLLLTVLFVAVTVSFSRYALPGLLMMGVYLIIGFTAGELSFRDALRRMRIVLPAVCIVGILNPFFDRETAFTLGGVSISGGVLAMVTLMVKAVYTVLAGYLLIATTTIEEIGHALRMLHLPRTFVTVLMLIYRYISVLAGEAARTTQAYLLRAPGQKGIAFHAWGPLVGQILIRSMDRAGELYESMLLRGFAGNFPAGRRRGRPERISSMLWILIWTAVLFLIRFAAG